MNPSKRKARSIGHVTLAALLGSVALCAPSTAQESRQATLPGDLPPYDIQPWLAAAAEREAAWANVEWRQDVLFDLLDGQRVAVEPGTRTTLMRTQPGKTWAQLVDQSNHTVETYLVEGAQCLVERRMDFGPDKDPARSQATYTQMTPSGIPVAILSRFGWTWDGLSIENLGAAQHRFLMQGSKKSQDGPFASWWWNRLCPRETLLHPFSWFGSTKTIPT